MGGSVGNILTGTAPKSMVRKAASSVAGAVRNSLSRDNIIKRNIGFLPSRSSAESDVRSAVSGAKRQLKRDPRR